MGILRDEGELLGSKSEARSTLGPPRVGNIRCVATSSHVPSSALQENAPRSGFIRLTASTAKAARSSHLRTVERIYTLDRDFLEPHQMDPDAVTTSRFPSVAAAVQQLCQRCDLRPSSTMISWFRLHPPVDVTPRAAQRLPVSWATRRGTGERPEAVRLETNRRGPTTPVSSSLSGWCS